MSLKKKINSADLCLFVGEFNPLIFKLIADKKGLTLHFAICFLYALYLFGLYFLHYCLLS